MASLSSIGSIASAHAAAVSISNKAHPNLITGRLVHFEDGIPLRRMEIRFGADIPAWRDRHETIFTDEDGFFSIDPDKLGEHGRLFFEVIETPCHLAGKDRACFLDSEETVTRQYIEKNSLGEIRVKHWEYQAGVPQLKLPKNGKDPETESLEYQARFLIGAAVPQLTGLALQQKGYTDSLKDIEAIYNATTGANKTQKEEAKNPGITKTGEYMGDLLLNGFYPVDLLKTEDPSKFKVEILFNPDEMDRENILPNATYDLTIDQNGPRVTRVGLQLRLDPGVGVVNPAVEHGGFLDESRLSPWFYYDETHPDFELALRFSRTAYVVKGETTAHLGKGHLNVEQYLAALERNIKFNPIKKLLAAHLRSVARIDKIGASDIFGKDGAITTASGLSDKGVRDHFTRGMGYFDWNVQPRTIRYPNHHYAIMENQFRTDIAEHVDWFFNDNLRAIKENWKEIKDFSDELVDRSVPYVPQDNRSLDDWADKQSIDCSCEPRVKINGIEKSIRPITHNLTPTDEDMTRLRNACIYMIEQPTFVHSHSHYKQDNAVGDPISFASLGLSKEAVKMVDGSLVFNRRVEVTRREDAVTQLKLDKTLMGVKAGRLLRNENGDVDPDLIEILSASRHLYKNHGFDVDEFLLSCTNI